MGMEKRIPGKKTLPGLQVSGRMLPSVFKKRGRLSKNRKRMIWTEHEERHVDNGSQDSRQTQRVLHANWSQVQIPGRVGLYSVNEDIQTQDMIQNPLHEGDTFLTPEKYESIQTFTQKVNEAALHGGLTRDCSEHLYGLPRRHVYAHAWKQADWFSLIKAASVWSDE